MLTTLRSVTALLLLWPAVLAAQSRPCAPSPHPSPLPPADSVLGPDGPRLLSAPLGNASDTIRFALHFLPDGSLLRLLPLSPGLPDSAASRIRNQARTRPFTDSWGLQVLLYPGERRELAFRASLHCDPTPPPPTGPAIESRIVRGAEVRRLELRGPARFSVELDTLGRVKRARLIRSSGDGEWDARFLDRARNQRYGPATLDGAPIPARYERQSDSL